MEGQTRYRRLTRLNWIDGGRDTIDFLKNHRFTRPIANIRLRFAFRVTATAGGTVGAPTQDASLQLMCDRLQLVAHHKEATEHYVLNLSGHALGQMWHFVNDLTGREQDFLDPLPTVSANLPGRREFIIPFNSPWSRNPYASRIDPRHLSQFQLQFEYGNDTDYAATNLSDIDLATIEVGCDEILEGIPEDGPYFLPSFKQMQQLVGATTQTDALVDGMIPGGLVPAFSVNPFDASAAGDAQRNVAGLLRRLSVFHGERRLVDMVPWDQLVYLTQRDFPLTSISSFTDRLGPITVLADAQRNFAAMLDAREDGITATIDTSSASQHGTTDVVAAAGDRADFMFLSLVPVNGMKPVLTRQGYREPTGRKNRE